MIIIKTNISWFNLWQLGISPTKPLLTHLNGFIFLSFLFARDKPLHWLLPNTRHIFFSKLQDRHTATPQKNPDLSGLNRYIWGFSYVTKKHKSGKVCFSTSSWTKKKYICQATCYLPIQYSFKDAREKYTVNQGCVKKSRQAFNINQINM